MLKAVLAAVLAVAPVMSSGAAVLRHTSEISLAPGETTRPSEPCWTVPVASAISDGFRPPACRWCPGNRGIEFASTPGEVILAPLSGRVAFDGEVARKRYLTISVIVGGSTLNVTLGGLDPATPVRQRGSPVARSEVLGAADGPVHLGVRIGAEYVDPSRWLVGSPYAPVLLPLDGSAPRQLLRRTSCS